MRRAFFNKPSVFRRARNKWDKFFFSFFAAASHFLPSGSRPVFCLGDSHITVWNYVDLYAPRKFPRFITFKVTGATALGLANPNSKTNALREYKAMLRKLPHGCSVLFNLGEVDCGFLVWTISAREGSTPEIVMDRSLGNYFDFVRSAIEDGFRVILQSIPLPTIGDGEPVGAVAKLRSGVFSSQRDRTLMSLKWNLEIKKFCSDLSLQFVDTDKILLDPDTGLIRDVFRHSDRGDHHLSSHPYALALLLALAENN